MQTGADTRLRRDQSDPRIRFSYEAGAGEVLAPCRADTRYWGPNKSMKHTPLDSAIASVLGVRSAGFPMQSTPFLQGIPFLYLALIMGLYLQPAPVFAQDPYQKQGDTKAAAGPPKVSHAKPDAIRHGPAGPGPAMASREVHSSARISNPSSEKASRSSFAATQNSSAVRQGFQQSNRSQASEQQTQTFAVRGNQANHYDGRWSAGNSHSNWDQRSDHRWHDHDYRWYDGGWLIIDTGYAPGYAPGYATGGSVGSNVQASLAQQGYYDGPIDGEIGRGTRAAIAHYESDNGLQVNGVIDEPLLVSLRLE